MRYARKLLTVLLLLSFSTVVASPDARLVEEIRGSADGTTFSIGIVRNYWRAGLPSDVRAMVDRQFEEYGSIRSRPDMINMVLGVDFAPTRNLPLAVFRHIIDASREAPSRAMMDAFNIQILSPDHPIDLPDAATLRTSFALDGHREYVDVKMSLRDGAYYIAYPTRVMTDNLDAAGALMIAAGGNVKPAYGLAIHDMSGFVFNDDTIENMPPLGAPVTINIRYGDVRIDTIFQWAGRPSAIPFNDGEEFLR